MYAAFLYDAVYQYAIALNKTLADSEEPNGGNIISKLLNNEYNSELTPFLCFVINLQCLKGTLCLQVITLSRY